MTKGPIAVRINAENNTFYHFSGGVFPSSDKACWSRTTNHAVSVVAYDEDTWTIRNSWGAGWGDRGNYVT